MTLDGGLENGDRHRNPRSAKVVIGLIQGVDFPRNCIHSFQIEKFSRMLRSSAAALVPRPFQVIYVNTFIVYMQRVLLPAVSILAKIVHRDQSALLLASSHKFLRDITFVRNGRKPP